MFSLTTTHLRFVCEATTPLRLEADTFRTGSNLRGALGQVMLRSYCPHPQPLSQEERGEHAATCPVHWLLAANEKPGEDRRGYALVPPLPNARGAGDVPAGEAFQHAFRGEGVSASLEDMVALHLALALLRRLGQLAAGHTVKGSQFHVLFEGPLFTRP